MKKDEKENLIWKKIYIGLFLVIILTPFVGMLFYKTDMTVEKRTPAPFPKVKTYDGKLNTKYFDQLNSYFNDHFAFRQELTTIDAILTTKLTRTSNNDDVIYGKDGWLYYEDTMDEYLGRNVLTDRGINNCATSLKLMQEYAEKNGTEFLFMVAPIKAYLYPEHMPDNYIKAGEVNNWSKLKPLMDAKAVKYVDLHEAFSGDSRVMYHKLDTHWNNEGAAFACKKIQAAVGRDATDYDSIDYERKNQFHGDLYGMLYPKGKTLDENVIYKNTFSYDYISDFYDTEDFNIETENQNKSDTLLMFRDSYGNALVPFMADEYGKGYFTKAMPFDLNYISEYNADVVMIELTQRHITYLWEYLPVMDAPLREDVTEAPQPVDMNAELAVENLNGELVVHGSVDPEFTSDDSPIYIRITDSKYISDYEAFPVGYGKADDKADKNYMYGMYIKPENLEKGECTFEIITEKDGTWYTSGEISTYNNN